jgi:SNF2 family DNA or RNA helicase
MMITTTKLLAHQKKAADLMEPIRINALFMEMGTGKSRTAIELAVRRQLRISNVIWYCPVSLKETVFQEILKHTDSTASDIHIFDSKTSVHTVPGVKWYIVGIESMSASKRVIFAANHITDKNSFVIVDESSYIKGHRSSRTNWITDISKKTRYRAILTGTPISQGVVDLFSQMRFLSPKILGYSSFYSFAHNHLEYHPDYPGLIVRSHNTDFIAAKIKPYVYQVTKQECLDLPDKLYSSRYFSMGAEQQRFYEQAKEEILFAIDTDQFESYTIFRLFTALQQIASGFWNRRDQKTGKMEFIEIDSRRIDWLLSIVNQIPENEKIIIWAKYRYDIDQIKTALQTFNQGISVFHGGLNEKKRHKQVEEFKQSNRFFLATLSCGGHGLTLNEAVTVVFYNNGFKYSECIQAEDRNHRIGQMRKVTYIDLVCADSIDSRIMSALNKKEDAVESFKREVDKIKDNKTNLKDLIKSL